MFCGRLGEAQQVVEGGGSGLMEFGPVLLVALGAVPAAWLVMRAGDRDVRTGAASAPRAR